MANKANKTTATEGDVQMFIAGIEDEQKRADSQALIELMRDVTGDEPVMWGDTMIGFGSYHYVYKSGQSGDWFEVGFSPRRQNITLYFNGSFEEPERAALLGRLGRHTVGKSCLYIKRLTDVDTGALRELAAHSVAWAKAQHVG
jgi:hypothetical protein